MSGCVIRNRQGTVLVPQQTSIVGAACFVYGSFVVLVVHVLDRVHLRVVGLVSLLLLLAMWLLVFCGSCCDNCARSFVFDLGFQVVSLLFTCMYLNPK